MQVSGRSSLWLRALPALAIAPGSDLLAVAMADEPALPHLLRAGVRVRALDWHVAALVAGVRAGLPPERTLAFDGAGPKLQAPADTALLDLAHLAGRQAFHLAAGLAAAALRPEGRLLLCGGNTDGIGGAERRLRAWSPAVRPLAYGGGRRILEARAPLAPQPPPVVGAEVRWRLAGVELRLRPAEAVFATGLPDVATGLLAEAAAPLAPGARACDLGCGGGALGMALLARGAPSCAFVDENLLALAAARRNLQVNGLLPRAALFAVDATAGVPGGPHDLVVCNPPFHDGPATDRGLGRALVRAAWAALAPGGRLLVVAHRFLRYEAEVPSLTEVAGDRSFRVLAAQAPGRSPARRREQ